MSADIILYGGDIITMVDDTPGGRSKVEEAVAILDGKIFDVGSQVSVFKHKGPNTQVIFLDQQTLMPGFIEPHQHAIMCATVRSMYTNISGLNCRSYSDVNKKMTEVMDGLKASDDPANGKWGLFFGWDPELISDLPTLSATYLDSNYSYEIPMAVMGQSGHVAWVNNAAFKKAGVDDSVEDHDGGVFVKDENGHLTGQLFEEPAMSQVIGCAPPPSPEETISAVHEQWKHYASVGITTVTDMAYMPIPTLDKLLKAIADTDDCPIRLGLYKVAHADKDDIPGVAKTKKPKTGLQMCCPRFDFFRSKGQIRKIEKNEEGIGNYNSKLWEAGIKLIADGSPHCGTAAVREPFLNMPLSETLGFPPAPGYGMLNFGSQALHDTIKRFNSVGKQVAVHCHGERASEQILKIYEQILAEDPSNTNRHRMEHLGLMTVEQIARAGKINVALSFFVDHLRYYALVYKTDIFGDRVNRWTPLSEATKNRVTWTIHQDHPTYPGDANPFSNMKTAVTRCTRDDPTTSYGPEYRVSIHEALKSYTVNAAWQLHLEKDVGSIAVGKKADLVVLSDNPYDVDPFDLESIRVVESFIGGHRNQLASLKLNGPKSNVYVLDHPVDA